MSVVEFVAWSGISRSTAYELIGTGQLPAVRVGRRVLIPRRGAEVFLAKRLQASTRAR